MLVAGGGGAYWASTAATAAAPRARARRAGTDPPSPSRWTRTPPRRGHERDDGIAPGEPDPHGGALRGDGKLPDGPDEAPVYRTDAEGHQGRGGAAGEGAGRLGQPPRRPRLLAGRRHAGRRGPVLRVSQSGPGQLVVLPYGTPGGTLACTCRSARPKAAEREPARPTATATARATGEERRDKAVSEEKAKRAAGRC